MALANGVEADTAKTRGIAPPSYRPPSSLDRYIDPLPLPRRLTPVGHQKDAIQYGVRMLETSHQMHSQLPPTRVWGYESQYPGPIFEAERGKPIDVRWENHLPSQHLFAIDCHMLEHEDNDMMRPFEVVPVKDSAAEG